MPSRKVTGLHPGTTYNVEVRAGNADGWSAWSAPVSATTEAYVPPTTSHPTALAVNFDAAPIATPEVGLYAATDWQDNDRFTIAGVEIRPYNVGAEVNLWDVGWCEDPLDETKTPTPRPEPLPPFEPVIPYAVDECGLSPANRVDVPNRARHLLALLESVRVEEKFAERLLTETPPAVGTFDIVGAVGEIEAELSVRGLRGWIHASPKFAAELAEAHLGVTTTPLGLAQWVFGGGYVDILGDTLVVTTQPYGWRSSVTVNSVIDHTHNRVLAVAERTVLIGYEAALLSVEVAAPAPLADDSAAQSSARGTQKKTEPAKKPEPAKSKS